MKTLKRLCSKHLAALSLAALGVIGLAGSAVAAAPAALAASAATCTTVSCVQQFGDQRIQARLAALDKLNLAATNHKGITSTQRSVIQNDVSANESGLKALKQQLDGETTITAARADVKNIYVQFRIYAVVLPRDYGEIWMFHQQNVVARMQDANDKISDLIQKAQQAGKDVSQLQALQQDYNAKLSDATTHLNNAQALIPSLVPSNFPGTTTTLKTYRADLRTSHQDIVAAAKDLHQMVLILKADLGS
jgi:hypothetical protein